MMSEHEVRIQVTRAEAATRLRELADQVARGVVTLEGHETRTPEQMRMKLQLDRDEVEVKLRW